MGNPTTLVELANITDFGDLPSFIRALIDKTNFKSPDGIMEYTTSPLRDGNEVDFVMNIALGSASDLACRNAMADGKARPYELLLPLADASLWKISGGLIVRNWVRTNPMADLRKGTLTVKYVTLPTEAANVVTP